MIGTLLAQEAPQQQPRQRRAAAAEAEGPVGALVTLDIVLIEHQGAAVENREASVPTAAALLQLDKEGKLDRVMRVRLSSVGGRRAVVQLGERVPVETARSRAFGGRGGGDAPFTSSYSLENIGTLISAAPRVEDGGAILVDLQVERSALADMPRPSESDRPDDPIARRKTVTLSCQTTIRLKPGEPKLAKSFQRTADKQSSGDFIVVTAHAESARPEPAAEVDRGGAGEFRVFSLATVKARDAAPLLEKILAGKEIRIAVDEATNTIVASGTREQLEVVEAILKRLDERKK
jgi:type II secretory pathway component GspD/PulD (secretin)